MDFFIKGQALERFIEEVATDYCDLYPEWADAFDKAVKEASDHLLLPTAMSPEGTMLNFCKLPEYIYPFVKHQAQKRLGIDDFWRDPEHYRLFCRIWKSCRVKRKPTQLLLIKNYQPQNV